jgi:hypothetical protein
VRNSEGYMANFADLALVARRASERATRVGGAKAYWEGSPDDFHRSWRGGINAGLADLPSREWREVMSAALRDPDFVRSVGVFNTLASGVTWNLDSGSSYGALWALMYRSAPADVVSGLHVPVATGKSAVATTSGLERTAFEVGARSHFLGTLGSSLREPPFNSASTVAEGRVAEPIGELQDLAG